MITPTTSETEAYVSAASPKNHVFGIDALRGLAALYVVLFHLPFIAQPNLSIPNWAKPLILQGGSGVCLFFVISAFTLTMSVRRRGTGPGTIFHFYTRRVFRIVPLYYTWLILSILRDKFLLSNGLTQRKLLLLLSVVLSYNFFPGLSEGIVWASWTLGVEMVFYLAFPFLYRVVNTLRRSLAFLALALSVAYAFKSVVSGLALSQEVKDQFFHLSLLHSLPLFASGMAAYFVYERWIEGRSVSRWAGVATLAAAAAGLIILPYTDEKVLLEEWYVYGFVYGLLVVGLTILPVRLLVNRFTRFYGDISYSVYLSHTTVIFLLSPLYRWVASHSTSASVIYFLSLLLTLLVLTPLSWLTYRYIELPFIRFGSSIIRYKLSRS